MDDTTTADLKAKAKALFWDGDPRPFLASLDDPRAPLDAAIWYVIERTHRDIDRHEKVNRVQRRRTWWVRIGVVIFGFAGGICPLLSKAVPTWDWLLPWGYVFFVVAGALLVVEKGFGFSAASVRTRKNVLRLRRAIDQFKFDIAAFGNADDPERRKELFDLLKQIAAEIDDILIKDADAWGTEYTGGLDTLASLSRSPRG